MSSESDEEYIKRLQKREARGIKYTTALREVQDNWDKK